MNYFTATLITLSIILSGCREKKNQKLTSSGPDSVGVFILKKEIISRELSLPAEIRPWERAEIFAKVEGYVKELRVDIGDRVRQNDVLAVLDAPEVTSNSAKAYSDLQAARSRYMTSLDTYNRIVDATKEKGTVSESEFERTRNQMLSDSALFMAAQSAAGAYSQLKNYLVIRAAFDGVITGRNVDPGTLVTGQKALLVLENISKLRLDVAVPEAYTSALLDTAGISFTVDAYPSKKYTAKFSRRSNLIDPKTRTELLEFTYENSGSGLKPGMYGKASIILHRDQPSFVVPYSAVVTNLERNFIIRIRDGKAEWISVRNGFNLKNKVEIFGSLNEGDKLITKATDEIKENTPLIPK